MARWRIRGNGFWLATVLVTGWIVYLCVVLTPPSHPSAHSPAPAAPPAAHQAPGRSSS